MLNNPTGNLYDDLLRMSRRMAHLHESAITAVDVEGITGGSVRMQDPHSAGFEFNIQGAQMVSPEGAEYAENILLYYDGKTLSYDIFDTNETVTYQGGLPEILTPEDLRAAWQDAENWVLA